MEVSWIPNNKTTQFDIIKKNHFTFLKAFAHAYTEDILLKGEGESISLHFLQMQNFPQVYPQIISLFKKETGLNLPTL